MAGILTAADSGRAEEAVIIGTMHGRPAEAVSLDCLYAAVDEPSELRFEMISADSEQDSEAAMLAAGANRLVSFQWNAGTGELSYTARAASAAITLPGAPVTAAAVQTTSSCESR
jgi:hypothetical protein